MNIVIVGAGLSGISLAHALQDSPKVDTITIYEKEKQIGGLCRSFTTDYGITYDIGPHIFFSKNTEILDFMKKILGDDISNHKRSNRIMHDNKYIQYPFENDLGQLTENEKKYILDTFTNNIYSNMSATNMRQFFLKTFGEGICNLYLLPYNEKIWKMDPTYMDTEMVERIPKPPIQDIINSINGIKSEGYLHQLYFSYTKKGGTQTFIDNYVKLLNNKVKIETNFGLEKVFFDTNQIANQTYDKLILTNPLYQATKYVRDARVREAGKNLHSNDLYVIIANIKGDVFGDNFALMTADKNIVFHRMSKLDFYGESYHKDGTTTMMIEVTKNSKSSKISETELLEKVKKGLGKEVEYISCQLFRDAYVINDLDHKKNKQIIFDYFKNNYNNVFFAGRNGTHSYLNMDQVIENAQNVAKEILS